MVWHVCSGQHHITELSIVDSDRVSCCHAWLPLLLQRSCSPGTVAGLSGYITDIDDRAAMPGASPLPFVSPSHGLGPQMHPRLVPPSHTSSPPYAAHTYSPPPLHAAQHLAGHQAAANTLHGHDAQGRHSMQAHVVDRQAPNFEFEQQQLNELLPAENSRPEQAHTAVGGKSSTKTAGADTDEAGERQHGTQTRKLAVNPVPALQTNLSALEAAISNTAASELPVSHTTTSAATAKSNHLAAAEVEPRQVPLPPLATAVAPKMTEPVRSEPAQSQQAVSAPAGNLEPHLPQQAVSMPASSLALNPAQQSVSMLSSVLAPRQPPQAVSMPPGNLAPIGPPAVRSMTSQVPGALPQLAAPALLPLAPVAKPSRVSDAATGAVNPLLAVNASAFVDKPSTSGSTDGSNRLGVSGKASGGSIGTVQSSGLTGLRPGASRGEQVSVSAASAVMLHEARAAGTARQAALAVLDEAPQPTWPVPQTRDSTSLPRQPFATAQTSSATQSSPLTQSIALPGLRLPNPTSDKPVGLMSMASSMGRPQSLMTMTGPLPASGAGPDPESPLGGRPSQSETAVTSGKGVVTVTEPQDLHAAHLVHVLQAHKASQQLSDSAPLSSELQPRQQMLDPAKAAGGSNAGVMAVSGGQQQLQSGYSGKHISFGRDLSTLSDKSGVVQSYLPWWSHLQQS